MYTISGNYFDEFKIKGSLFKSYTFEVNNMPDVKKYISQLENKFPDASHICYAYRICNIDNLDMFYNPEVIELFNDDGEPSSTAGRPILNVLKKSEIVNRIIFVIRYFGGTKLGINGLIESYKHAAELVITNANYEEWVLYKSIKIRL
jgi:putative IMPACT (imprinted ancient) family translation regulator